jgi:hypothetical protein
MITGGVVINSTDGLIVGTNVLAYEHQGIFIGIMGQIPKSHNEMSVVGPAHLGKRAGFEGGDECGDLIVGYQDVFVFTQPPGKGQGNKTHKSVL